MRIALALHDGFGLPSVRHVMRSLVSFLGEAHDLCGVSPSVLSLSADEQVLAWTAVVRTADLLLGYHSTLEPLLRARAAAAVDVPCVLLALGAFPRGALSIRRVLSLLTTRDRIVVTSSADAALARAFLDNARVVHVPLSYDAAVYGAATAQARHATRASLGCTEASALLMYSGRLTLEKNVHSVLRVFAAVSQLVPDAHLVIAGPVLDVPFHEFGVYPVSFSRTLAHVMSALALAPERVHLLGPVNDAERLQALYGAADLMINLTLHHDENFGLVQVEAAACGTPTVGTAWGGLRDTVRLDGGGYPVSVSNTASGVKVNWWEAVNGAGALLTSRGAERTRRRAAALALSTQYHPSVIHRRWCDVIAEVTTDRQPAEPVLATADAARFWAACAPQASAKHPIYRHGAPSFDHYRRMIAPYGLAGDAAVGDDASLREDDLLLLPSPVTCGPHRELVVQDPLFPCRYAVPSAVTDSVEAALECFTRTPVMRLAELLSTHCHRDALRAGIDWLRLHGVLLGTRPGDGWCDPRQCAEFTAIAPFSIAPVDRGADFILLQDSE